MIRKNKIHKIWAFVLALLLLLTNISVGSFAYTSQVGTIKGSAVNVRSGPGTSYSKLGSLNLGTQVVVNDEIRADDGSMWCVITYQNGAKSGYVSKDYVAMASTNNIVSEQSFEQMLSAQGFPESYKPYLRELHSQYPNWTFKAVKTGLDWSKAVAEESVVGRNLVNKSSKTSWKSTAEGAYDWNSNYWPGFDGAEWQAASTEIIAYYMDPRNFLDSVYVFQFLDHQFDSNIHTGAGLVSMLKGTFMESAYSGSVSITPSSTSGVLLVSPSQFLAMQASGTLPSQTGSTSSGPSSSQLSSGGGPGVGGGSSGESYADLLMKAATASNVNPYVLASMIIQEQGKNGTGASISGNNSSYPGIYNFYNIEAYQSGTTAAIEQGLKWAAQSGTYERPWNTREKSIVGGAKYYSEGYVQKKQNTFYLKKFNVIGSDTYKHQYMTNVQAAASEGYHLAQAYTSEVKTSAHDFEIPVYNNMPDVPAQCPTGDGNPNNKLGGLGVDGFAFTPAFDSNTLNYNMVVDTSVTSVNVQAVPLVNSAGVSGTGNVNVSNGGKIQIYVKAENGTYRTYTINVTKQNNGPTYNPSIGGMMYSSSSGSSGPGYVNSGPGASGTTVTIQTTNQSSSSPSTGAVKEKVLLIGPGA